MGKHILAGLSLVLSLSIAGCSMPAAAKQGHIYSFTKQTTKGKGFLAKSRESVKDFRGIDMYTEDIDALKEEVEQYISDNSGLSDDIKKNLRDIKVAPGENKEQVLLLIGQPDKRDGDDIWIYRISKWRAFTVFIVPVMFVREGYYLYFDGDTLVDIERHYLKQTITQSASAGLYEQGSSSDNVE